MPRHRRAEEKKEEKQYKEQYPSSRVVYVPSFRTGSGVRFGYYTKKRRN